MKAINYVARWHLSAKGDVRDVMVTLPMRLRSPMNGSHGHWAPQAARRRKERQHASWGCGGPLAEYRTGLAKGYVAGVVVTITRIAPRALDDDNLRAGAKSVRDGITDALGLSDDRDPRLRWEYGQEKGKPNEYAVRIVVTGTTA
jgi:hypothetical protein